MWHQNSPGMNYDCLYQSSNYDYYYYFVILHRDIQVWLIFLLKNTLKKGSGLENLPEVPASSSWKRRKHLFVDKDCVILPDQHSETWVHFAATVNSLQSQMHQADLWPLLYCIQ